MSAALLQPVEDAPNSPSNWDKLWEAEGRDTWRGQALSAVYERIIGLLPGVPGFVIDVGGGVGVLAHQIQEKTSHRVLLLEQSDVALETARQNFVTGVRFDITKDVLNPRGSLECHDECVFPWSGIHVEFCMTRARAVVATEVLEHLSAEDRHRFLEQASKLPMAFFSVPNDRLGPEEEPQHTIKFTAKSFLEELKKYFKHVRVECLGPVQPDTRAPAFLLAVCGQPKEFTLSVTLPVRNEEADLAMTLASFRGVADEMVVGVDPRTTDNTFEVAQKYADVVFYLESPEGKGDERVRAEDGVHFGNIRNQCMDKCTSDWIFMTEGHEYLARGVNELLMLHALPEDTKVVNVLRTGGPPGNRQRWGFPWLCRNDPAIRYRRSTHNILAYPPEYRDNVSLPGVQTLHERVHKREVERAVQRSAQNRVTLMDDWIRNQNEQSLYYLAVEWREHDPAKAVETLREFLALPATDTNGPMRYNARLVLAKMIAQSAKELGETASDAYRTKMLDARAVLLGCVIDDWSRSDHWVWLGDIAFELDRFQEALQFYHYAATAIGKPPFTMWWIDLSYYAYIPAQRLAMTYGAIGQDKDALFWANRVLEIYLGDGEIPSEMIEEAKANIAILTQE